MLDGLLILPLFAQDPPAGGGADPFMSLLPLMAIFLGLYWFIVAMPQRRESKRRDEMLNTLKKNDRIVTIGGILGSVANVSPDGKEVTVKVDDNTRIKFLRSSIQQVLKDEEKEEPAPKS